MRSLAAHNGGRVGLVALVAILLLGLALRAGYAWEGRAPVYDAAAYARIAANLERGEGFALGESATQPASNYSPGLPLLAGGLYKLTGGVDERLARLALALLGTLSVLFAYLIGRRLLSPLAGLIGAATVAIYPALLEYQGMLMSEPLAATLLSGSVLSMLWADGMRRDRSSGGWRRGRQDPPAKWLVPGALLGALALTRPEYLAISLPIAVVVFARRGRSGWHPGLADAALLLGGLLVVVAPWTIRNAVALDRFVPISTGGGQVLFAGSYMPSGGDPERVGLEVLRRHPGLARQLAARYLPPGAPPSLDPVLDRVRLEQILAALAAQRYPELESDRALARMGRERLWEGVSEQPLEYAGFVAAKVGRLWSHGPRNTMQKPVWEALHLALVALGLLGLTLLTRKRPWEALLLATLIVSITAVGALLVASPRRVLVAIPLVAALAGVVATACRDSLARRWKP